MEYSVLETKNILNYWGLDFSEGYIRDLLREGKLKGNIYSRKKGWVIHEKDLQEYLENRIPAAKDYSLKDYRLAYS